VTAPPEDGTTFDGWKYRVLIDEEWADLARRFPDVAVWFGAATRRWWALVRSTGRWRLVEAGGPHDLSHLIASARAAPARPVNVPPARAVPASAHRPASSPEPRRRGRHARA
jgi:hypothetical protein